MSYDFALYTTRAYDLVPPDLGPGALLGLYGPDRCEDEDLPPEYLPTLGRRRLMYGLTLEGDPTPAAAARLDAWLRDAVVQTKGILIDLQTESWESPTKSGVLGPPPTARKARLQYHLYTEDDAPFPDPPEADITIAPPQQITPEDVPPEYLPAIGDARVQHVVQITGKPKRAQLDAMEDWLMDQRAARRGTLIDLQTGAWFSRRSAGQIRRKTVEPPTLSLNIKDAEGFYRTGFAQMLAILTDCFPEVFPLRYGLWEPLQHRIERGQDLAPLLRMFHDEGGLLLKARAPFGHVGLSIPCEKRMAQFHPDHPTRRYLLVANIRFDLSTKVFTDPGLLTRVEDMFKRLCTELNVLHGEIRREGAGGFGWFWNGLPHGNRHMVCLGPTYQALWPEARAAGVPLGARHLLMTTDRRGTAPPPVPEALRNPLQDTGQAAPQFAPVMPFGFTWTR
ncbi:MAG: hypothetical protein AAFQ50_07165 [Pseudomonadota bacterium]